MINSIMSALQSKNLIEPMNKKDINYSLAQSSVNSKAELIFIIVSINGNEYKAIIDCASTISIISAELIKQIGCKIDSTNKIMIKDINNNSETTEGTVKVELIIEQNTFNFNFVVKKEFGFDMLIGNDILQNCSIIDLITMKIKIENLFGCA